MKQGTSEEERATKEVRTNVDRNEDKNSWCEKREKLGRSERQEE